MKRAFGVAAVLAAALLFPKAYAYQDSQTWEFHFFGGRAAFDSFELGAESFSLPDFDEDGTLLARSDFRREIEIDDGGFAGLRLGFLWTPQIGTEFSYDKNRTPAEYSHALRGVDVDRDGTKDPFDIDIDGDGTGGDQETVAGGASLRIVTYQVGILFHPLGKLKTRWQPFASLGMGYIDANLDFPRSLAQNIAQSDALPALGVKDFAHDDQSWVVSYGIGLKCFLSDAFGLRADVRRKSSDLFDQRRDDFEGTFGISIFVPGLVH